MCCVCCVVEIAFGVYVLFSLRHLHDVCLTLCDIEVCLVSLFIVRCLSAYVRWCVFMIDAFLLRVVFGVCVLCCYCCVLLFGVSVFVMTCFFCYLACLWVFYLVEKSVYDVIVCLYRLFVCVVFSCCLFRVFVCRVVVCVCLCVCQLVLSVRYVFICVCAC